MNGRLGHSRRNIELFLDRGSLAGLTRARAELSRNRLFRQRRAAVRKARWINTYGVAKKRLRQLWARIASPRFGWPELLLGQLLAVTCAGTLWLQLSGSAPLPARTTGSSVNSQHPPAPVEVKPDRSLVAAAAAAPKHVEADQCRLAALTQLYPSEGEDGIALRFEPTLSTMSPLTTEYTP